MEDVVQIATLDDNVYGLQGKYPFRFQNFPGERDVFKSIKKIPVNTSSYPEECLTCRFARFVVLKIDVVCFQVPIHL